MSAKNGLPGIRIDAHHHFWTYSREEYGWIDESMAVIRRDFLPEHLEPEIRACGIDGVVSVQARQTLEETRRLLALASQRDFIRGVVGWVPLIAPEIRDIISSLTGQGRLKAVRHVLQAEPDDEFMLRDDFNRGIDWLGEFGLVYDILIFERHLPQAIQFVDRHPKQTFVLDHIAKPRIRDHLISPWRENLRALAERPNVYCKISGMVTEADYNAWTKEDLAPYFDTVLHTFGPDRLMFGSDWPVCLLGMTYRGWFNLVLEQIASLSDAEQNAILGGTAIRAYRLAS
jgi:L-fuconolactonase